MLVELSFSELVLESDVFPLLEEYGKKTLAYEHSSLKQSAFYDYARLYQIKEYLKGKKLNKKQCGEIHNIVKSLAKSYPYNSVLQALNKCEYSLNLEHDLSTELNKAEDLYEQSNKALLSHYSSVKVDGLEYPLFPIQEVTDAEIQLLAFSRWSLAFSSPTNFKQLKAYFEKNHTDLVFIYKHETPADALKEIASRIIKGLPPHLFYRATELLVCSSDKHSQVILSLIQNKRFLLNNECSH